MQLVFQSIMTDPLFSFIPAPPNSLLDLILNVNLHLETMVHYMCEVKYRQHDALYEPVLFESLYKVRLSCVMFKVTKFC